MEILYYKFNVISKIKPTNCIKKGSWDFKAKSYFILSCQLSFLFGDGDGDMSSNNVSLQIEVGVIFSIKLLFL